MKTLRNLEKVENGFRDTLYLRGAEIKTGVYSCHASNYLGEASDTKEISGGKVHFYLTLKVLGA